MKTAEYPWHVRCDGTIVCRECNHRYSEYELSHYPDCRFFDVEEVEEDDDELYKLLDEYKEKEHILHT
ncbi:MAG: hypothetical protein N3A63_05390 [Bacteroidetes bacterium]|nr:hypothetical protein [Bacteroidota bacterium]